MDEKINITELDVENVFRDKNIKLHDITKVVSNQLNIVIHENSINTTIDYNSELVKMYWHEAILEYVKMYQLKPCPFCGDDPDLSTNGTFIDIDCCVSMSRQKGDYLEISERKTYDNGKHMYSDIVELKVLKEVVKEWNHRV